MSKHPTLLEQFRSFCFQNSATDLEKAVEYFSVFGGMGWRVDLSKPLEELIEEKVLANYRYIHGDITKITQSNNIHHSLLTALATGDRREHSAFKKANVKREEGEESIDFLIENGLLVFDRSLEKPVDEKDANSDKLLFTQPFMRFWFSSISPYYKSIREGDYKEMKEHWSHMKHSFSDLIYDQLVMELMKKSFKDDPKGGYIASIGGHKSQIERIRNRQTPSLCRFNPQSAFRNPKSNNSVFCLFSDFRIPTSEFQYLLLQIPHRHSPVTPFLSFADLIVIDIVKIKYARRRRYGIRL